MLGQSTYRISFSLKIVMALITACALFLLSLLLGAASISLDDLWLAIRTPAANSLTLAIHEIRFPREIAAVLVGSALSVAGAIMQGITRNPLADPGLLGLTAGANAALVLSFILLPSIPYYGIIMVCFIGAAIGVLLVFGISSLNKGSLSTFRIVLAGSVVSSFLFAMGEVLAIYFKVSKEVAMWTAGGLIGTDWTQIRIITPIMLIGIAAAILLSRELTVLSLSEEAAVGLGQKTIRVKILLFIIIILLSGASVALVGRMAFIGLMVPHIVRLFTGKDYKYIIPMSAIVGAGFMLFADTLGRTINAPFETSAAAIIAVIGLPFFILIVRKGGKSL